MSEETTCGGMSKCICSPGSGAGALPCEWQDGPTTDQSGREAARASRFPLPAGDGAQLTLGIFGPRCEDSSPSASRKSSSASKSHPQKLSARSLKLLSLSRFRPATTRGLIGSLTDLLAARVFTTGEDGSMEYQQTLRNLVTPGGTPYAAHTASGRRTSGRDCGGWPTARAEDDNRSLEAYQEMLAKRGDANRTEISSLQVASQLAGWPTPVSNDDNKSPEAHLAMKQRMGERDGTGANRTAITSLSVLARAQGWPTARAEDSESTGAHRGSPDTLTSAAQVSGWPTPKTPTGGGESAERKQELGRAESGGGDLQAAATLAGWCTPNAMDGGQTSRGGDRIGEALLAGQAQAAGWATPTTQDGENVDGASRFNRNSLPLNAEVQVVTGAQPGSSAATGPRGVLNPQFPLWLMGYPEAWATCAPGWSEWELCQEAMLRRS
jgi:hypothetical protein